MNFVEWTLVFIVVDINSGWHANLSRLVLECRIIRALLRLFIITLFKNVALAVAILLLNFLLAAHTFKTRRMFGIEIDFTVVKSLREAALA